MVYLAVAAMAGGMWLLWRQGPGWAADVRRQRVVGLVAVGVIAACLLGEKAAWSLKVMPWDEWTFFERVPLHLAILALLTVAWWDARARRRLALGVLTGVFLAYAGAEVSAPAFLPLVAGQLDATTWGEGRYAREVQQSTGWSCAPAALAWALRVSGVPASEREMAVFSAAMPVHGTSWRGMVRALHRRGFAAQIQSPANWEQLLSAPKPALADWRLNAATSHMIVVLAATPAEVTVGDPLLGETTYAADEFRSRWQRGLLTFERGPGD